MSLKQSLGIGYSIPNAALAFSNLLRDPDDTKNVTRFRDAVNPHWYDQAVTRFRATSAGQRLIAKRDAIYEVLVDRDYLASLPDGSVGKLYFDFTEANDLSPDGFRETYHALGHDLSKFDADAALVHYRIIDIHDLLHIVTGYGRETFGEVCILAYQGIEFEDRGLLWLSYTASLRVKLICKSYPVFACITEAKRIAHASNDMATADWRALMPAPLEEARAALNLAPPAIYWEHRNEWLRADRLYRARLSGSAHGAPSSEAAPPS
ncbi:MAG: Coq4 family protein [Pseudomonadota bacterium]